MPPLFFEKIFSKSDYKQVVIRGQGSHDGPASGKHWLILNGIIAHTTGTLTAIWKAKKKTGHPTTLPTFPSGWARLIPAASASEAYNLFSTIADTESQTGAVTQSAQQPILNIMDDTEIIYISVAGANAAVFLDVIEW